MEYPVSVTTFERGEQQAERNLSRRIAGRAGFAAAAVVGGVSVVATAVFVALTFVSGFVLHTPIFVASWTAVTALAAGVAFRRARDRAERFRIGARMDVDAFANLDLDLVRPGEHGVGYELALTAGMTGFLRQGSASHPIEGLVGERGFVGVPLVEEATASIDLGTATFLVRALPPVPDGADNPLPLPPPRTALALPGLGARRFAKAALKAAPVAGFLSLLAAAQGPARLSDADLASAIPPYATPLQIEQFLRQQAQTQADSLHACFDPLPRICQKAGYVGVGLRLAANGVIQRSWVSRTTYGSDCPVTACMERMIGGWFFEPVRTPTTVIIPVQVLRSDSTHPAYAPIRLAAVDPVIVPSVSSTP